MRRTYRPLIVIGILMAMVGCGSSQPIPTVKSVDLNRFMGKWYVIANIPTFIEKNAFNAVESYRMNENGTVATTFRFREGSYEGEEKVYHPTGFILDQKSNAVWGMQFIWPIKADYRIVFLTEDYSQTIIGRNRRDYLWIMARTPQVSDDDFEQLLHMALELGYDVSKIQKVPQKWNGMGGT